MDYTQLLQWGLFFTAIAATASKSRGVRWCVFLLIADYALCWAAYLQWGAPSESNVVTSRFYVAIDMAAAFLMLRASGKWPGMLAGTYFPEILAHLAFINAPSDQYGYWFKLYDVAWSQIALVWLWGATDGLHRFNPMWARFASWTRGKTVGSLTRALEKIKSEYVPPIWRWVLHKIGVIWTAKLIARSFIRFNAPPPAGDAW